MKNIVNIHSSLFGPEATIQEKVAPSFVQFVGGFNESNAKDFRVNFRKAEDRALNIGQEVLPVVIDSFGGDVYALLSMVDVVKNSRLKVATIVEGKAMSCGAIFFSCGAEGYRYIGKNATVLIHDVSSWSMGKVEEIKMHAKEAERLNKLVYTLMANNCAVDENYYYDIVAEKRGADWFLSPEECVECKLANKIGLPSFTTEVKVQHTFR